MPAIKEILERGGLKDTERKVLDVLEKHPDYIWSNSFKDLAELSLWTLDPDSKDPPQIIAEITTDRLGRQKPLRLSINSRPKARVKSGEAKSYSLRTITSALAALEKMGLSRSWLLFGKTYYGAISAEQNLKAYNAAISDLNSTLEFDRLNSAIHLNNVPGKSAHESYYSRLFNGKASQDKNPTEESQERP